jgi:hypothetical protein
VNQRATIWELADRIQMDLNNAQARLVELRSHLAQTDIPKLKADVRHPCPECKTAGITHDLRSASKLAEHRYHSHDGPLPNHYAAAEAIALEPDHRDPGDETA